MKIEELVKGFKGLNIEGTLFNYIKLHPDEVYGYYDETLHKEFPKMNQDTLNWSLWNLAKDKRIGKFKIGRRAYYGSNEAIEELRKRLTKEKKPKQ